MVTTAAAVVPLFTLHEQDALLRLTEAHGGGDALKRLLPDFVVSIMVELCSIEAGNDLSSPSSSPPPLRVDQLARRVYPTKERALASQGRARGDTPADGHFLVQVDVASQKGKQHGEWVFKAGFVLMRFREYVEMKLWRERGAYGEPPKQFKEEANAVAAVIADNVSQKQQHCSFYLPPPVPRPLALTSYGAVCGPHHCYHYINGNTFYKPFLDIDGDASGTQGDAMGFVDLVGLIVDTWCGCIADALPLISLRATATATTMAVAGGEQHHHRRNDDEGRCSYVREHCSVHFSEGLWDGRKRSAHVHLLRGAYCPDATAAKDVAVETKRRLTCPRLGFGRRGEAASALVDDGVFNRGGRALRDTGSTKMSSTPPRVLLQVPDAVLSGSVARRMYEEDRYLFELLMHPNVVAPSDLCDGNEMRPVFVRSRKRSRFSGGKVVERGVEPYSLPPPPPLSSLAPPPPPPPLLSSSSSLLLAPPLSAQSGSETGSFGFTLQLPWETTATTESVEREYDDDDDEYWEDEREEEAMQKRQRTTAVAPPPEASLGEMVELRGELLRNTHDLVKRALGCAIHEEGLASSIAGVTSGCTASGSVYIVRESENEVEERRRRRQQQAKDDDGDDGGGNDSPDATLPSTFLSSLPLPKCLRFTVAKHSCPGAHMCRHAKKGGEASGRDTCARGSVSAATRCHNSNTRRVQIRNIRYPPEVPVATGEVSVGCWCARMTAPTRLEHFRVEAIKPYGKTYLDEVAWAASSA